MSIGINTYVVSNRKDDQTIGEIQFLYSANVPNQRYNDHLASFQHTTQQDWQQRLATDLFDICGGKPVHVVLNFLVHGFNNTAQDAVTGAALYGKALYAEGLTHGIVVCVSWPSMFTVPVNGRNNAVASWALLKTALDSFKAIQKILDDSYGANAPRLVRVITAHSMGNYLMSQALTTGHITNFAGLADSVLMLAPDVDHAIFTQDSDVLDQGMAIYQMASGNVRVYWTGLDDVLQKDEYLGWWKILGYRGALEPVSPRTPNVSFNRYDKYADFAVSSRYVPADYYPSAVNNGVPHSASRFVPDLILDELSFISWKAWSQLPNGPGWSDGAGWANPQYYTTIQCADVDGDGQAELLARSASGIAVWRSDKATGAWSQLPNGPGWSDASGWAQPQFYSTIRCADIDGDGQAELLARSTTGIIAWKCNKDTHAWAQWPEGPGLSDSAGWAHPQYYSTIQYADLDGDGQAELIARSAAGIIVWKCNKDTHAWSLLPAGPPLSDAAGWAQPQFYSTIQCADIDGDGQAELIARGASGIHVWKLDKDSHTWSQLPNGPDWGDAGGWANPQYYSTIRCVDIDGDGQAELIARGASGIHVWKCDKTTRSWSRLPHGPALSDGAGWGQPRYYSTIRYADIDGDGQLEMLARGARGIHVWKCSKTTHEWTSLPHGPDLSDDAGWGKPQFYETIQYADVSAGGRAELIARGVTGILVWRYEPE